MSLDPTDNGVPGIHHAMAQTDAAKPSFTVGWASCEDDVRAAQRLRYEVFGSELGATVAGAQAGMDVDRFDAYCDHLLVRAASDDAGVPGVLLGTYRVLPPGAARRAGAFYSDAEFDLGPLKALRSNAVELGRSCVHPAWRSGAVILALWVGLGDYMLRHRLETMIGCASVSVADGGHRASELWHCLRQTYLADPEWQVRPRKPLPLQPAPTVLDAGAFPQHTPPLIKGYLRCGAKVLGPPALDSAFNTADLPIMLRIAELAPRYRKHFLGAQQ